MFTKMTAGGGYTQHKFYLGRDESKARLAWHVLTRPRT